MSIHKSQGSEFPVVILPITSSSHRMLQRNLIYTAITRAKSKLILLGEKSAFAFAVKNTGTTRKTYLLQRFANLPTDEKIMHTSVDDLKTSVEDCVLTEENFSKINPMIGLTEEDIHSIFGN